jgi:hypothetical protein
MTARDDDVIHVYVVDSDTFRVNYDDRHSESSYVHYYDWDGLCNYLESMRQLLAVDADPFDTIQLQVPGFPCVSVKPLVFACDKTYEAFSNVIDAYVEQVTA